MNGLMVGGEAGAERAPLCLGSIEITEDGIAECTREGHRSVFVPRADIERVTLGDGFTSERPVATLLGAAVFLGGAAVMFWRVFSALNGHYLGTKFRILTIGLLFTVVGAMFLWTLVQRGRYLRVDTARDRHVASRRRVAGERIDHSDTLDLALRGRGRP